MEVNMSYNLMLLLGCAKNFYVIGLVREGLLKAKVRTGFDEGETLGVGRNIADY